VVVKIEGLMIPLNSKT